LPRSGASRERLPTSCSQDFTVKLYW
jgi:hypothetical protein